MRTVIYFATGNPEEIRRICREYGLTGGMSVNGEMDCRLPAGTLRRLQEEESGLVQIRRKPETKPPAPAKRRDEYTSPPPPRNAQQGEKKPKHRAPMKRKPADARQTNMFNQENE